MNENIKFFIKWLICCLNKHKRRKTFHNKFCHIKVNLGAGEVITDGWINIDSGLTTFMATMPYIILFICRNITRTHLKEWFNTIIRLKRKNCYFIHYDLNYGIPLTNETADFIYSSHLLEHFSSKKGTILLKECHRVLKPGGTLRICVPDLEKLVDLYVKGERVRFIKSFFSECRGADEHYGKHRFMYDYTLLNEAMGKAGFNKIVRCEYQKGNVPELNKLDSQTEITLYVEATK